MDFIERIFGISPDGGSGLFELLLFVGPLLGLAAMAALRQARRGDPRAAPRPGRRDGRR